jgi:hypothetical protein
MFLLHMTLPFPSTLQVIVKATWNSIAVSFSLAVLVLLLSSANVYVALLAALTIVGIVTTVLGERREGERVQLQRSSYPSPFPSFRSNLSYQPSSSSRGDPSASSRVSVRQFS